MKSKSKSGTNRYQLCVPLWFLLLSNVGDSLCMYWWHSDLIFLTLHQSLRLRKDKRMSLYVKKIRSYRPSALPRILRMSSIVLLDKLHTLIDLTYLPCLPMCASTVCWSEWFFKFFLRTHPSLHTINVYRQIGRLGWLFIRVVVWMSNPHMCRSW
jgi:hypothetical protein